MQTASDPTEQTVFSPTKATPRTPSLCASASVVRLLVGKSIGQRITFESTDPEHSVPLSGDHDKHVIFEEWYTMRLFFTCKFQNREEKEKKKGT